MVKGDKKLAMGDCAINIAPNEDELAEIAIETAKTAKIFGIDPKVAMLSYSTYGSGKGEMVTLMANATKKVKEMAPDLDIDGELQFDAAVAPEVAKVKCAGSTVAGQANTFIFQKSVLVTSDIRLRHVLVNTKQSDQFFRDLMHRSPI